MVFFKYYLITLTFIAIAIWVMPAVANDLQKNGEILRSYCSGILTAAGYKDQQNAGIITKINYKKNIPLNDAAIEVVLSNILAEIPAIEADISTKEKIASNFAIEYKTTMRELEYFIHPVHMFCLSRIPVDVKTDAKRKDFFKKMFNIAK